MGWDRNASDDRKRAYMLKKMTSMPMLAGDALHRALEEWFQARESGREFTPEEVEQSALAILRRGYKDSRDGNWRRKSKLVHLTEHHYEDSRVDEASGRAWLTIRSAARGRGPRGGAARPGRAERPW